MRCAMLCRCDLKRAVMYRDCAKNMDANLGNERWGLFYVIDRPSVLEVEKQVEI